MSTFSTIAAVDRASRASPRRRRWMREPLVHFIAIGAFLFAIDHALVGRRDDPHVIVVPESVDHQARELFKSSRGREPDADELHALRRVWLDNEVLYREGLAMQVDKGDTAIRERVILKALSVVDSNVRLPPVDDATLRDYFARNRTKYDEPARYDFEEAVLAGDPSEGSARDFADALNRGSPGDAKAGLRVFKGRPRGNLEQSYGAGFAAALEASPPGQWRVYRAADAWRVMRLDAITPSRPARYESLRGVVLQDWTDHELSEQRSAAVKALARKYVVRYEPA
jgi:parvulin-like peptidyl-prolyl cis-trans isomerase-like protein